jgi:formate dehydrogenase major subunit
MSLAVRLLRLCARSANEDIYMLQKMARTAFKTNNIDN